MSRFCIVTVDLQCTYYVQCMTLGIAQSTLYSTCNVDDNFLSEMVVNIKRTIRLGIITLALACIYV